MHISAHVKALRKSTCHSYLHLLRAIQAAIATLGAIPTQIDNVSMQRAARLQTLQDGIELLQRLQICESDLQCRQEEAFAELVGGRFGAPAGRPSQAIGAEEAECADEDDGGSAV